MKALFEILQDSLFFCRTCFIKICAIFLSIYVPELIVSLYLESSIITEESSIVLKSIPSLLEMIADGIFTAGLIFLFNSILKGSDLSLKDSISKGILNFPLFFATVIITRLLVICGLILLIVPGIILLARLSLAKFYFLLSDDSPFEAIKHSFVQTKGYTNTIISTILIAATPLIITIGLLLLGHLIMDFRYDFSPYIIIFIFDILLGFYSVFFLVILFRIFSLINQEALSSNKVLNMDS